MRLGTSLHVLVIAMACSLFSPEYYTFCEQGTAPMSKAPVQIPSTTTRMDWLWATRARGDEGDRSGKWMIFAPVADVDHAWLMIATAVRKGGSLYGLADQAKVATKRNSGRTHLVCIYTSDFNDVPTIAKCLYELRRLGFKQRLFYKTDQQTLAGVYAGGKSRPWLYASEMFEPSGEHWPFVGHLWPF